MQHPPFLFLFFAFLSIFSPLLISSQSPPPPVPPQSPSDACKSTLYPKLCRSILKTFPSSSSNPYEYSKFSVKQCHKQAKRLSKAINYHLTHKNQRSKMTHEEFGALQDCHELMELNVDYFETISSELKSAASMNDVLVERVKSLLSGVVTNQQSCYDGLVQSKSSIASALSVPLSNGTQLYSVSLALVTHSLGKNLKKNKGRKGSHHRGILRKGVREPLETLIKALKKTASCHKSSNCHREERILSGDADDGILLNDSVIVGPYGDDNFTTITDAIAFAPNSSKPEDGYFVIFVREGIYEEYVVVPKKKKNIMMIGEGINRTVITGNHSVVDGWTTFNSSTFAVSGERFVGVYMTFRNTAGPQKHQAVALRNNADLSTFYRCSFEGYQDTLYVHSLRQFYRECDIYGTVDFIFGNAAAVFQNCNLYARKPLLNQKNAFTAQGRTDPNQNTGISIQNCTIEAAPDLAMDKNSTGRNSTSNFLGRPWKVYSRTVIMQSYIGELIQPAGWLEWNGTVGLDTIYYGEFQNYGPGANTSRRVKWPGYNLMNATQAANFTVYNLTTGDIWLPYTDIPFSGGLL
ncbi:PREDICTED: probable pectinesterase/pectinesterase inhibitor 25 [Populus euphratica]|uniref:Pectinesterase n=1 Tax=Populus euphratica TaxID=75702 RepID=A0AAJ6XW28_POPEU|nr:PREDICTED: probable pectinesterase/pectinesterase inhibitor 25 [Populus euphratica]